MVWPLGAGTSAGPALDRRVLADSLHRLLEDWRAAERRVAELVADRETASPQATSMLLDAIATYRAEYQRLAGVLLGLARIDEE